MSECYLCGSYIERGSGYRRQVQTSTSTRFYMTRHGGTSVGFRSGLRTVCANCASKIDKLQDGGAGRCLLLALAYLVSVWLGWQLFIQGSPMLGMICMLGFPVGVGALILEGVRRSTIWNEEPAAGRALRGADHPSNQRSTARQANECVADWVERSLSTFPDLNRQMMFAYAEQHPPRVGETLQDWVKSWPEWNQEWDLSRQMGLQTFRAEDTILSWADRLTDRIANLPDSDPDKFYRGTIAAAKYVRPQVGETFDQFQARFKIWYQAFDHDLDLTSMASAMRPDETIEDWLARTTPVWMEPDDGESVDTMIRVMAELASRCPPCSNESAQEWMTRAFDSFEESAES